MNISMYMGYALEQACDNPISIFKHFYKKGIRFGDIVDDELLDMPLHYYCDCLNSAGITPNALVSMLNIADFDPVKKAKNIAIVKGYIDQMEKLDIPILMPAPSVKRAETPDEFKKMKECMTDSYFKLCEYSKGSGVKVAIENQSLITRPDSKTDDLLEILNSIPDLGFVFDTGNFFCVGENAIYAYEKLKDRIVHCHFKDWKVSSQGYFSRENLPNFDGVTLGEGQIELREIISLLKRDNYAGNLVLEINSPCITMDMLDKSADFLYNELS